VEAEGWRSRESMDVVLSENRYPLANEQAEHG